MRKYKNNNWKLVLVLAFIIVVVGGIVFIYHHNIQNDKIFDDVGKEDNVSGDNDSDVVDDSTEKEQKDEQKADDTQEYNYITQDGEEVKVEANKAVEATGFSGASNYKFYLRGTTLYFLDASISSNTEEILAYNVKDLYLENKEVVAELYSDGEIVKENSYITYK